ncbi:hypothetical protein DMENIID0001_042710 [Sergentomyia squamirostris]
MLDLVEHYKERVRKQQVEAAEVPESMEEEVPENREGPKEEPDSTADLQLLAAAIELLPDQNSLNDVGRQDQDQKTPASDSTADLQLLAGATELLPDQYSLNNVGRQGQDQKSRQVEVVEVPGSSSSRVKKKLSSLPAPSKESLQHLLKRMDDEASTKDCKQEVVPMPRINTAAEEPMDVDVLPPPPPPPPAAPVPVNDDYRIHVINRFVDLALGLYRQ